MPHRFIIALAALLAAFLPSPVGAEVARGGPGYTWRLFVNSHAAPLFYQATGIAVGSSGNLFIADSGNHRIEKFSPSGSLLASWGADRPGPYQFDGPRAVAVDADGNIYLADNGVIKLSFTGQVLSRRTGGVLSYPRGLAVDRSRNLYVLSLHPVPFSPLFDRITITKLARNGKVLGSFVYAYPQPVGDAALGAAIATTPNGNLLLSIMAQRHCHACDGTYYLLRTISPSGRTLAEVSETAGGGSMAVDGTGAVYLTESNAIEKLSPTGALITTFGGVGCGLGKLGADLRVASSPLGSLYVADSQLAAIRPDTIPAPFRDGVLHQFGFDGTPMALLGMCPSPGARTLFGQINDLAVTPGRLAYVADDITGRIDRIAPSGAMAGGFDATHPSTVTTDRQGNIYVPDLERDVLEQHAPDGRLLASTAGLAIEASAVARNGAVYALTVFGEVLVLPPVGHGARPLRRWWLNGYARGTSGLDPQGICLDGQGNVWVADIRHNNIQKYSPSGRLLLIWGRDGTGPSRFHNPNGLTVDGRGDLFVLDGGNDRVQEFDLRGRFLAMFGREGQAPGQFLSPWGIGADANGNIYVGDRGNDRIQELVRQANTERAAIIGAPSSPILGWANGLAQNVAEGVSHTE
jgi:tripartite motif-containing protein 71